MPFNSQAQQAGSGTQSSMEEAARTCWPSRVAAPAMAACWAAGSWKSTKAKVSLSFCFLRLTGAAPRSAPNTPNTSASFSVVTLSGRLRTKMLVPGGPSSLVKYLEAGRCSVTSMMSICTTGCLSDIRHRRRTHWTSWPARSPRRLSADHDASLHPSHGDSGSYQSSLTASLTPEQD